MQVVWILASTIKKKNQNGRERERYVGILQLSVDKNFLKEDFS